MKLVEPEGGGADSSYKHTLKCLVLGHPKTNNFPFGTNGKLMVLGVPLFISNRVAPLGEWIHQQGH